MTVHLSPYARNNEVVFTSGQGGFNEQGLIQGDIAEQTVRTLRCIEKLLAESDLTLADVGKTTVWLARAEDFAAFNSAYADVFGNHKPARTTVVSGLVVAGGLVEIEAIAWKHAVADAGTSKHG
ncbi:RidA family protein [Bradyrhizobium barranii subsp. apii]|uniref:RidA family protein n=1 Tax=Bradyrhizobium barranii subsp. apii TaxID=2819348 RepID=A0A8T5V5L5_9BRAD|nr:RidA family protein [Bradyrhizobium barranii]UPT86971.1 RidA family protein [Bradyrhizobium barranii subsp. apii]